jgi:hypothetical protein
MKVSRPPSSTIKSSGGTPNNHFFVLGFGLISLCLFLILTLPFFNSSGAIDAEHFNHWVKTNFRFGDSALDNSVLSPYQGLGGLVQPLAVRIHIPYLAAYLFSPGHMEGVVTVVSAFIFAVAVFCLCRAMGAGALCSIVAGQIAAVFFFPPLWLFLLPWSHFMTVELFSYLPALAYPAALGVIFLALFLKLGACNRNANILIAFCLTSVFVYSTIVDPLYTAMFWIPIGFFCIVILCGSENKEVFLWRIGVGIAAFLMCLFAGIFHFYYALFKNAARAVFPNELYVEIQTWDKLTGMFSHGGWSFIISLGLVVSSVYVAIKKKRVRARSCRERDSLFFRNGCCLACLYLLGNSVELAIACLLGGRGRSGLSQLYVPCHRRIVNFHTQESSCSSRGTCQGCYFGKHCSDSCNYNLSGICFSEPQNSGSSKYTCQKRTRWTRF